MTPVILNQSEGKWIFEDLAQTLARSLWVDARENAGSFNYILSTDRELKNLAIDSFIPIESIAIAADKRAIEGRFAAANVPRPQTFILASTAEIDAIIARSDRQRWILKYPTGCGGLNHRIIENSTQIPTNWPQPFLLQAFIESRQPEVYRLYGGTAIYLALMPEDLHLPILLIRGYPMRMEPDIIMAKLPIEGRSKLLARH